MRLAGSRETRHWRTSTKLASVRREGTDWHPIHGRGNDRCVGIAVHGSMIDAEHSSLAIKERVWAWIGGAFYNIFSDDNVTACTADNSTHCVNLIV